MKENLKQTIKGFVTLTLLASTPTIYSNTFGFLETMTIDAIKGRTAVEEHVKNIEYPETCKIFGAKSYLWVREILYK